MIARPIEKDLSFILKPAKGPGVNDPRPIPLIFRAMRMRGFGVSSTRRLPRLLGVRRECLALERLLFSAGPDHGILD